MSGAEQKFAESYYTPVQRDAGQFFALSIIGKKNLNFLVQSCDYARNRSKLHEIYGYQTEGRRGCDCLQPNARFGAKFGSESRRPGTIKYLSLKSKFGIKFGKGNIEPKLENHGRGEK